MNELKRTSMGRRAWLYDRGLLLDIRQSVQSDASKLPWWRWLARRRWRFVADFLHDFVAEGDRRS